MHVLDMCHTLMSCYMPLAAFCRRGCGAINMCDTCVRLVDMCGTRTGHVSQLNELLLVSCGFLPPRL